MIDKSNTVCFSGHRSYSGADADDMRLAEAVKAALQDGYRTFISGMAAGFDLAAAEAVVRLREMPPGKVLPTNAENMAKPRVVLPGNTETIRDSTYGPGTDISGIRLIAALPFLRQAAKYSAEDRARYEKLLAVADEVVVLSGSYSYGCYYRRDEWMVERSGRIICWYAGAVGKQMALRRDSGSFWSSGGVTNSDNGNSNSNGNGTRYTVRKAVAAGLEVVNLFRTKNTLF